MKVQVRQFAYFPPDAPPMIHPALGKVLNATYKTGPVLLGTLTYRLNRIAEAVNSAWENFEKARRAIIAALDAEDAEANKDKAEDDRVDWRMNPEQVLKFNEEFNALIDTEIEIAVTPLPLGVIDQARDLELSRVDMLDLAWLFESEEAAHAAGASA